MTKFAVIQNGTRIVFGVGDTEQGAWNDAREWADNLKRMHCSKCSDAFSDYVLEYGGDFDFVEHEGVAYLLNEWEEQK